jgi:MFS transporter, ACS family, hexuronate transporter
MLERPQPDSPSPSAPETAGGRYRWLICALLFAATTILYIDRQILSLLKSTLDEEFHWTNEQFGDATAAFQVSYGIGLLGYGWFVDRFGVKIGYALTMAGSSLAAMGHSLVFAVRGFMLARGAPGLAESGNFPSAVKAVALWFPQKERALAAAVFNSGANVGPVLAPATIPFAAAAWGWRSTFIILAAIGVLWQAGWWFFYETSQRQKRLTRRELAWIQSDAEDEPASNMSWPRLLNHRQTWAYAIAKFLTDPVWWFFLFWLPDYFKKSRGLDIKQSWVYLVSIYGLVTVVSIFGGWITGHLVKLGWSVTRARKSGLFCFALCVTPICMATSASIWGAVALIGLAASAHQAWSANLYTTVSDIFPKKAVASVVGIGGMAGSIGGICFPHFTGQLLDHFEKLGRPTEGYSILFGICACAYIVAFAANHLLAPRFVPIHLD